MKKKALLLVLTLLMGLTGFNFDDDYSNVLTVSVRLTPSNIYYPLLSSSYTPPSTGRQTLGLVFKVVGSA